VRVGPSLVAFVAFVAFAVVVAAAPRAARAQEDGPEIHCGEVIDADPTTMRERAIEHFNRARVLYLDGQYEACIPEYISSYCLLPNSGAAYNLANAYLFLVDYEQGLRWMQLYVRIAGPDEEHDRQVAANRIDRIRKLPARVSVSTQPPYARITLTSDEGVIEGRADDPAPLKAPAGAYTMRVALDGYEPVEQKVELRIGQPYTYNFRLSELEGAVRITTSPLSARIFVDDKLVAVGTYVGELPLGGHKVSVEAEGRKPRTQDLEVTGSGTATLFVSLPPPPQSGRWELISGMTVLAAASGAGLGSTLFDPDSSGASLITLGAGAVGFAGGYFGVGEHIPVGHTSWIIGGTAWGAAEFALVANLFTDQADIVGPVAFAGAIGGAIASSLTVRRFDPSAGDSAFINSGGLWGGVGGIFLWALFREDGDDSSQHFPAFVLAGMDTGLLAGATLAYRYEYSRGHLALIDVAGLAGAVTGVVLASPLEDSTGFGSSDTPLHFAFGGMILGLVTGAALTRDMDVEKVPTAVTAAIPKFGMSRTMAGEMVPTLSWSGSW
jgi:hypothetical protein